MSQILDQQYTWMQRDFGLDRRLIKALSKLNFTHPTLVQASSIPIAIQGRDMLVRARTGSGKTYAYGLPLLHKLLIYKSAVSLEEYQSLGVYGIILAPTKELCKQIEKSMNDVTYYCKDQVKIVSLVNDELNPQANQYILKQSSPDIVISTPAKLVQYLNGSGSSNHKTTSKSNPLIKISNIKMLILDEADLILSFGYAEDVTAITSHIPKVVQGLLMSATLSPALDKFKRIVLNNPAILKLEEPTNTGKLLQFYLTCQPQDKYLILYVFLKLGLLQGKGLIFVNDVNKCYRLKLVLQQFFINAAVMNSEMPLNSRLHILDEFNRGVFDYLIATDASIDTGNDDDSDEDDDEEQDDEDKEPTSPRKRRNVSEDDMEEANASSRSNSKGQKNKADKELGTGYGVHRGLDFQNVSFVINFDFPATSAAYTHRIGRTARGGASGTALSFVSLPHIPGDGIREDDNSERDLRILQEVQHQQPRLGIVEGDNVLAAIGATGNMDDTDDLSKLQPSPLAFDMKEIETFRYRVEDTVRSVTGAAVKELRAAELKREILNSEKLKSFFSENPNDFKILRHDKAIVHPVQVKDHLRAVPNYLIPQSMQAIASTEMKRNKKRKRLNGKTQQENVNSSKMRDPLKNPTVAIESEEPSNQDNEEKSGPLEGSSDKVFTDRELKDGIGYGMSGRKLWKLKHRKGKFNPKLQKKNSSRVPGSFQGKKGG